jgi:hypothetical protein
MKKLLFLLLLIIATNLVSAQDYILKNFIDHFSITKGGQGIGIYGNDIKDSQGNYFLKSNSLFDTTNIVHIRGIETITGAKIFSVDQTFRTLTLGYGGGNVPSNILLGTGFNSATTGIHNLGIGNKVLTALTTGYWNLGIMDDASQSVTTGVFNFGIGVNALRYNTTGSDNLAIGRRSFQNIATGVANTGIGHLTGYSATGAGSYNTLIGNYAGYTGSYGSGNIFIGVYAGNGYSGDNQFVLANGTWANSNPTPLLKGDFSTGQLALPTAPVTSAGGYSILTRNTSTGAIETVGGAGSNGIGSVTSVGVTGANGILVSGASPITGSGSFALQVDSTQYQTVSGLFSKTDSRYYQASNPSGYISSISGIPAGGDLSGSFPNPTVAKFNGQLPSYYLDYNNLANKPAIPRDSNIVHINGTEAVMGQKTFSKDIIVNGIVIGTTGALTNTVVGSQTGSFTSGFNAFYGFGAGGVSPTTTQSSAFGYHALQHVTGYPNDAFGATSLRSLTIGYRNAAFGIWSGRDVTTGNDNVFIGEYAGASFNGGNGVTTGSNNVLIGSMAGWNSGNFSNKLKIGSGNNFYVATNNLLDGDFAAQTLLINGKLSSRDAPIGPNDVVRLGDLTGGTVAVAPSGIAGGDLTGTYPNPTVNTINNISASYYDPTSSIQTQLNGKAPAGGGTLAYTHTMSYGLLGGNFNNSGNITSVVDTTVIKSKAGALTDYNNLLSGIASKVNNSDTTTAYANLVHKAGAETITGPKTFSQDITVNGYTLGLGGHTIAGLKNTVFGLQAGAALTTGNFNAGFGYQSLNLLTYGTNNTGFGYEALKFLVNGSFNTAFGAFALEHVTSGIHNIGVGRTTGASLTTGYANVLMGDAAGYGLMTGKRNTMIGGASGQTANSADSLNVYIGNAAGYGIKGSENVIIGAFAGLNSGTFNKKLIIAVGDSTNTNPNQLISGDFAAQTLLINGRLSSRDAPIGPTDVVRLGDLTGGTVAVAPSGTAGGDLTGTYPNPTVNTINNISASYYDPTSSIQTQLNGKAPAGGGTLAYTHTMSYGLLGGNFNNSGNITSVVDTTVIKSKAGALADYNNLMSGLASKISSSDTAAAYANLVHKTGAETITGPKTFSAASTFNEADFNSGINLHTGFGESFYNFDNSHSVLLYTANLSANANVQLPTQSGTLALLSDIGTALPGQTGNSGKYLTTDGTTASWASVTGGLTTANNGLSVSGTAAQLGGALTKNTTIDIGGHSLAIGYPNDGSGFTSLLTVFGSSFDATWNDTFHTAELGLAPGGQGVTLKLFESGTGKMQELAISPFQMVIKDEINSKGFVYDADYSANYVARSLVDKGYVDRVAGTSSSIPSQTGNSGKYLTTDGTTLSWTAAAGISFTDNGLSLSGDTVKLGGVLTRNTNIDNSSFPLSFTRDITVNGIKIGTGASNINSNTVIGLNSGTSTTTGTNNTLIGNAVGQSLTDGGFVTAVGTRAAQSVQLAGSTQKFGLDAFGYRSLGFVTTGEGNVGFGALSGKGVVDGAYNTFIGGNAGGNNSLTASVIHGSRNVFIGAFAGSFSGDVSDKLIIAAGQFTNQNPTPLIYGDFSTGLVNLSKLQVSTAPATATDVVRLGDLSPSALASSATPTISVTGAGTGATAYINGTNTDGYITIAAGTSPSTMQITVTFSGGFAYAHSVTPVISPYSASAGTLGYYVSGLGTNTFTISQLASATAGGYYYYTYHAGGY